MTLQTPLRVLILDSRKGEKCEARCGLDWSAPGVMEGVKELFQELYHEKVQVEYSDLANGEIRRLYPEVMKRVREQNLPSPLLVLNGKIRLAGYFDIRMLQDAVQVEIELSYG